MSKLRIFVSATIVLILTAGPSAALAHPSPEMPPPTATDEAAEQREWSPLPVDENLAITGADPVTKSSPRKTARYYPYRQQLTFRVGRASPSPKFDFDDSVLGFQYLFPKFLSPKLEAGADLHQEGRGHLHVGMRWIYREREYFRPSGKISFDHLADADDRLATLTHFENYFARVSGTLEFVFWNPVSFRFEPELLFNGTSSYVVITVGLSQGW